MKSHISALFATSLVLASGSAIAGTTVSTTSEPMMTTSTDDGWQFTAGLYAWMAGLDGTIGAAGYTTDVGISFSDILDTLDMTAMGAFEVRKGPWMLQLEGLYLKNSDGVSGIAPNGTPVTLKLTAETTRLEPVIGYRVVETDATKVDLIAGAVYYDISNRLIVTGGGAAASAKSQDSWWDPIVGVRVNQRFNERWSGQFRGEIGGFGVNADLVWQLVGLVGYDFTENTTGFFGYRHAAVDYQNGGFTYDAASSGPILGLAITF
ncbi:MAG: hypothetical protein H7A49_10685 [Akkermansiaceae bacterium]|nr:hypothetical protein [Akkermansiaceae bacterium]MCP5544355.1 hypothetical protein [Akkermansiaceae bacterium]MCP5547421.1 hypothetical protein [Akkermansiaceae bacterium]